MKKFYTLVLVISFLTLLSHQANAAIRYVKVGGTGNSSSWANASGNLKFVLDNCLPGDEIWIEKGTYVGSFLIKTGIKVFGGFNGQTDKTKRVITDITVLKGNGLERVVEMHQGAEIHRVEITGGHSNDDGGGILISNSSLSISMINECTITGNYAKKKGGGITVANPNSPFSSVKNRHIIINCKITANTSEQNGGGISASGGVYIDIINTIISGNLCTGNDVPHSFFIPNGTGAGVFSYGNARTYIVNSTIVSNHSANGQVGGLADYGWSASIKNSIIKFNGSTNTYFLFFPSGNYFPSTNMVDLTIPGEGTFFSPDPKFANPRPFTEAPTNEGDYSLSYCSPAINAGKNEDYHIDIGEYNSHQVWQPLYYPIPMTEISYSNRFTGNIDIGAVEYLGTPSYDFSVVYVDQNRPGNSAGDGKSWETAYKSLGVILWAQYGSSCLSEVRVAQGTYKTETFEQRNGSLDIMMGHFNLMGGYPTGGGARNPDLYPTVLSSEIGNLNTLNDNNYHTVVILKDKNSLPGNNNVIDGFIIEGGQANGNSNKEYASMDFSHLTYVDQNEGGAVHIINTSPTFKNCIFRNNYASSSGGAILIKEKAYPVFDKCTFQFNGSSNGGAVKVINNSKATFLNCVFKNNVVTGNGGAIALDQTSTAEVYNTKFNTNLADGEGGAIHHQNGGFLTLEKSVFTDNAARYGGAVRLLGGNIDFNANANIFNDNTAYENGAGALSIIPGNGKTVITNNVFTGNKTLQGTDNQSSGGGSIVQEGGNGTYIINNTFYNEKAYSGVSSVHFKAGGTDRFMQNNIFYQNTSTSGSSLPNWSAASGTIATASNNLENTNPIFVNSANPIGVDNIWGTSDDGLRLQSNSPAINQGIATNATLTDLIGSTRIQDGAIDLGAYETAPTVLPVNLISFTAKMENNVAVLRWETSSEKDNEGFEIFRSSDAKNFISLGTIAGKGTTDIKNSYVWTDRKPLNGINYYKLVQKDKDGKTEELGIRPLTFSFNGEEVIFYPNPVKEKANVRFTAGIYDNITLSDINGRTIQNISLNNSEAEKAIIMDNLTNGTYFLRLQGDGKKAVVKIIKN